MFLLEPVYKDYIWGGTLLARRFGKGVGMPAVAESWELSTHRDGLTRLPDGQPLRDYLAEHPGVGGKSVGQDGQLPILVKLIDAQKPLSVQVHPDDEYAGRTAGERGKTELWHVLDAAPGAFLYLGVNRPVTREELESRIRDNTVEEILCKVPVHPGESYFVPAGMLHAIGAGCLICEVQESSNLTYRVYDYGRVGADGKPRPLHIQDALAVVRLTPTDTTPPGGGGAERNGGLQSRTIVRCPYFTLCELTVATDAFYSAPMDSFCHLICVEGGATAIQNEMRLSLPAGTSLFLNAGETVTLQGSGRLLAVSAGAI